MEDFNRKQRVFFHELGHFVASEINHKRYCISPVEKIKIIRHLNGGAVDYSGETIYEVPEDQTRDMPVVNLPQKLANLVYGCYFQSLFLNEELKLCFDQKNTGANGFEDMNYTISALAQFGISGSKRKLFYPFIEIEYFTELKNEGHLKRFFQLDTKGYLLEEYNGVTEFNLPKLREDIASLIDLHTNKFSRFIERIEEILDWQNSKGNLLGKPK